MRSIAIDCIAELIYQSTWKQSAYDNRLKGFLAEALAPTELVLLKGYKSFKGGWILPLIQKERFRNMDRILYLTILTKEDFLINQQKYCEIYNQLENFSDKYTAVYQIDFNNTMQLSHQFSTKLFPEIKIDFFKFDMNSNAFINASYEEIRSLSPKEPEVWKKPNTESIDRSYNKVLEQLNDDSLYDILADRYVFDYLFGLLFFNRGIPADFDMIVNFPDLPKKYVVYEIKEKDPSKANRNTNNVVGFGMDIDRIDDYAIFISWFPKFEFRYLVRQINNQKDRNFVAWRSIGMQKFIGLSISDPEGKSGGVGMLPSHLAKGHISTAICPIDEFKTIQI